MNIDWARCLEIVRRFEANDCKTDYERLFLEFIELTKPAFAKRMREIPIAERWQNGLESGGEMSSYKFYDELGVRFIGSKRLSRLKDGAIYLLKNGEILVVHCTRFTKEHGDAYYSWGQWKGESYHLKTSGLDYETSRRYTLSLWSKLEEIAYKTPRKELPNELLHNLDEKRKAIALERAKKRAIERKELKESQEMEERWSLFLSRTNSLCSEDSPLKARLKALDDLAKSNDDDSFRSIWNFYLESRIETPKELEARAVSFLISNAENRKRTKSFCQEEIREQKRKFGDANKFSFEETGKLLFLLGRISPSKEKALAKSVIKLLLDEPPQANSQYFVYGTLSLLKPYNKEKWTQDSVIHIWRKYRKRFFRIYLDRTELQRAVEIFLDRSLTFRERI